MKFTFDENKINIFTLIPYGKMREDIVVKKCIESWKKIPNSAIYLFDMQDIKDTFPGMVENDKYYKILNNEYLKPGEEPTEKIPLYEPEQWGCPETKYKVSDYVIKKEQNLSTDVLRLKILQEIPNSIYMDSDMYIINEKAFMDLLYDDRVRCYKNYLLPTCSFVVKKGKERSFIIDEFIKHYDNLNDMIVYDHVAWLIFYSAFKIKYGSNKTKIEEFNLFDNPYRANDINKNLPDDRRRVHPPYVIHLFSLKHLIRQSKIRGIDFNDENVIDFNVLCFDIRNDTFKFRCFSNNRNIVDIYLKMINMNKLSTNKSILLTDMIVFLTGNEGSDVKNLSDFKNINDFNDASRMMCFENLFELYTYYKCEKNIDDFKQFLKDNIIYNIMGIDKRCNIKFNFYEIDNDVRDISKIQ